MATTLKATAIGIRLAFVAKEEKPMMRLLLSSAILLPRWLDSMDMGAPSMELLFRNGLLGCRDEDFAYVARYRTQPGSVAGI
jgi:hypothetical protein